MRTRFSVLAATAAAALTLAACGSEGIDVDEGDADSQAGAEIFAANCAGCHTMTPAGSTGSGNRQLRAQGPNFDQRYIGADEALYAIRNGGFSGAIMPQNIVVGEEAQLVSDFIDQYSGTEAEDSPRPSPTPGSESETSAEDTVEADGLAEGQPGTRPDVDSADDTIRGEGRSAQGERDSGGGGGGEVSGGGGASGTDDASSAGGS